MPFDLVFAEVQDRIREKLAEKALDEEDEEEIDKTIKVSKWYEPIIGRVLTRAQQGIFASRNNLKATKKKKK